VTEVHHILREQVFTEIVQENLNIRSRFKDLDMLDSIYDSRSIDSDDKEFDFDDLIVNSKAYRNVMRAATRQASLRGDSSRLSRVASQEAASPQVHQNVSNYIQDLLGDMPSTVSPQLAQDLPVFPPVPAHDSEENLVDLSDPDSQPRPVQLPQSLNISRSIPVAASSPHMDDLKDILWSSPHQSASATVPPSSVASNSTDRRDSGRSHLRQSNELAVYFPDDKIPLSPTTEEKIVIQPPSQDDEIGVTPHDRSIYSSDISRRGTVSSVISQSYQVLSDATRLHSLAASTSPELPSPLTPVESYFGFRRTSSAEDLIPPTDDILEQKLLYDMGQYLGSSDPNFQLEWAEDALRYCRMCSDFEERVSKTQQRRRNVPEGEAKLRQIGTQVVDGFVTAGDGRALFIKARFMETDTKLVSEHLEGARRAGFHRAHYWLGQQCLDEKNRFAEFHFETGAQQGDQACQYVSELPTFRLQASYM
jgi:hypothetical protein